MRELLNKWRQIQMKIQIRFKLNEGKANKNIIIINLELIIISVMQNWRMAKKKAKGLMVYSMLKNIKLSNT